MWFSPDQIIKFDLFHSAVPQSIQNDYLSRAI